MGQTKRYISGLSFNKKEGQNYISQHVKEGLHKSPVQEMLIIREYFVSEKLKLFKTSN